MWGSKLLVNFELCHLNALRYVRTAQNYYEAKVQENIQ